MKAQMTPDTGGPAFPVTDQGENVWSGATLLDWFAGQAMAGMIQSEQWEETLSEALAEVFGEMEPPEDAHGFRMYARAAYIMGAAMLAEKRRLESPGSPPKATTKENRG